MKTGKNHALIKYDFINQKQTSYKASLEANEGPI